MKLECVLLACVACVSAVAAPVISNVAWSQDPATRRVTVTYDLNERAIVTMDVCTNGTVSIGGEHVVSLIGAVNCEVPAGEGHRIEWLADRDWAGRVMAAGALTVTLRAWTREVPPDYLVVDLRMTNTATCSTLRYYADAAFIPGGVTNDLYKTKKLVMRRIPASGAIWRMGSPSDETGRSTGQVEPEHYVSFESDYYMGVYPVTMGQYRQLCGITPATAMSSFDMSIITNFDAHPAGGISYAYNNKDASSAYLRNATWPSSTAWSRSNFYSRGPLARLYDISGIPFDLPTEAQWEYACRAGVDTAYNSGKACTTTGETSACPNMDEVGWYSANTSTTQPVGLKRANLWGLYDMHGNVWEWCLDWYDTISETASSAPVSEPLGAASGTDDKRVRRGGGYSSGAKYCRSASRGNAVNTGNYLNHGFRLFCPVPANW